MESFKISAVFIGGVVGAGLATGREMITYFRGASIVTMPVVACVLALMCVAFLYIGKFYDKMAFRYRKLFKTIEILMLITMFMTFVIMAAGVKNIAANYWGLPVTGLLICALTTLGASRSDKVLKTVNLTLVPIIVVMLAVLFAKRGLYVGEGFPVFNTATYCAMNITLGGLLITKHGKYLSRGKIIATAVIVAVTMCAVLIAAYSIAMLSPDSAMPIPDAAATSAGKTVAAVVVMLAIVTTMIGSARMVYTGVCALSGKFAVTVFLLCGAFIGYAGDFKILVDYIYPPLGIMGIIIIAMIAAACAFYLVNLRISISKQLKRRANIGAVS